MQEGRQKILDALKAPIDDYPITHHIINGNNDTHTGTLELFRNCLINFGFCAIHIRLLEYTTGNNKTSFFRASRDHCLKCLFSSAMVSVSFLSNDVFVFLSPDSSLNKTVADLLTNPEILKIGYCINRTLKLLQRLSFMHTPANFIFDISELRQVPTKGVIRIKKNANEPTGTACLVNGYAKLVLLFMREDPEKAVQVLESAHSFPAILFNAPASFVENYVRDNPAWLDQVTRASMWTLLCALITLHWSIVPAECEVRSPEAYVSMVCQHFTILQFRRLRNHIEILSP